MLYHQNRSAQVKAGSRPRAASHTLPPSMMRRHGLPSRASARPRKQVTGTNSSAEASEGRSRPSPPAIFHQQFTVTYDYPVYFTEDVFAPIDPVLVDTLMRLEKTKRHRCLFFIDDGVISACSALL